MSRLITHAVYTDIFTGEPLRQPNNPTRNLTMATTPQVPKDIAFALGLPENATIPECLAAIEALGGTTPPAEVARTEFARYGGKYGRLGITATEARKCKERGIDPEKFMATKRKIQADAKQTNLTGKFNMPPNRGAR